MSERGAAGSIYDLGYRPYDGARLGRGYALLSLYTYSLRAVFGLGRSTLSKVFPFGLAGLALLPAAAQLAIAAIAPLEVEVVAPEDYFGYVQIILALFCAVVAPEIIGRDQRNRTLTLYFSRALSRSDYVGAKAGALATGLAAVLLVPQILLFLGSAVATQDVTGYLADDIGRVPPVLASSAVVAVFMASVSLLIASLTPRRAFATGGIVVYFVVATLVGSILVETTTGDVRSYAGLLSPVNVLEGSVRWLFDARPPEGSDLAKSDLAGGFYMLAAVAYTAASLALLLRRFYRMGV